MTEFVSVPAIVAICYGIGYVIKKIGSEKLDKFIPLICFLTGAILGLLAFYTIPDFIGATNWITALAIGIVSGLSATGANQIYKQLKKE
jgi:hypothetical protein